MRLKIKRLDPTIPLPSYGTDEAAGFDLAAAHDVIVPAGRITLVRTGLIIEVPSGDRLAQGIVLPAPRVEWHEVADVRDTTRGGFGATGN